MGDISRRVFSLDNLVKHVGCGSVDEMHACVFCDQIRARLQQTRDYSDVRRDYDQVREILAADMTMQPDTAPLPQLPSHVGALAVAVYALVSEVRQLRWRNHEA